MDHVDVLIVGAGLSGIGAGYRLQTQCPELTYTILEGRDVIGGTWDLFRYPGIRSDSDMYTFGYPFRPWHGDRSFADGSSILEYVRATASESGVDRRIRFGHQVSAATWSSQTARWTVRAVADGQPVELTCSFLYVCSGYYSYEAGYLPEIPGLSNFDGPVVHPQFWPEDLDWSGKRVVVIGSGATAVTLLPAMADDALRITMLQRSPSYVVSLPARDVVADRIRKWLPDNIAHRLVRAKNIVSALAFYQFCQRMPDLARRVIRTGAARRLRGSMPVDPHFAPTYDPWDQRMCLVPDADLFRALRSGHADIVTGRIDAVTDHGIRLDSGDELEADMLITATGLRIVPAGGIALTVDGQQVDPGEAYVYRGTMLSGVPNFALCLGYTNASWTLRADLVSLYVCRLLNHLRRKGYRIATPEYHGDGRTRPLLGLSSGYVQRAAGMLPRQGTHSPWRMHQNYLLDLPTMRFGRIDASMTFTR
ncbi:MAG: NAD(P)/FAD-dependent oxidoreductase [Rhodococcus sp. (in: high G+C Gram-positive bacteria)]|uniref:flavin-containing monooxygenase n=1 Tax=Rhodococcus sp. TaxID=1831 RepID=UPI003BB69965